MRLAATETPDGQEVELCSAGGDFVIRIGGRELMSSRAHGSEARLAELVCPRLADPEPRVLIGGLGMGYTLRAALDCLPPRASVVVAELVDEIVSWNRGPLAHLAGNPLADSRVTVVAQDVAVLVSNSNASLDAALLDVDNGPSALAREQNRRLYDSTGLEAFRRALKRAGILAVWSADPDPAFESRMKKAGFSIEVHVLPARGLRDDPDHTVYVGAMQP